MNASTLVALRMVNHQLQSPSFGTAEDLTSWMGALQAQDYRMVKWAMGIRLPGATKTTIEEAIEDGKIIRTHLLRPTWHFVAARDLRWLLKLTAPRIKVAIRSRHKQLGITDEVVSKSNAVITNALDSGDHLIREALVEALEKAGFENKDNMASHLLLRAELEGLICSGPSRGNQHTYALLDERVPEMDLPDKGEARARLARIYFSSHGPATLEDFTWWSGLTKTSARKGLEAISDDFISEEINGHSYWMSEALTSVDVTPAGNAYLLPAYDEFLISYRNRIIPDEENQQKAISNNGIFRPIIVVGGKVVGIWKRSIQKGRVLIETEFFDRPAEGTREKVEAAARAYGQFLDKECEVRHHDPS